MDMEIFETKEFLKALRHMRRLGGRKAKAAEQVLVMRSSVGLFDDPFQSLRKTKNGETRIAGCIKYDLTDFCRLITIVGNGSVFLLFVGDHDEADAWLEKNRGLTIGAVSGQSLGRTKISDSESGLIIDNEPDNWSGELLDRLPEDLSERLIGDRPFREVKSIRQVKAGSPAELILNAVSSIPDEGLRGALFDILVLLNGGSIEEAENRALLQLGDFKPIAELSTEELLELDMGDGIRKVELGSKEYSDWVSRFIETSHPFDWFLFMHPEQERHVTADYSGAAKLSGVTGSGKTSIAVKRAVRLARLYEGEKVLVLSLNRALCEFISEIVDHACGPDAALRERIEVSSLFSVCQTLLREFEPDKIKSYSDVTWGLEEHKDEIYREFYRCLSNVRDAEVLRPMHRLLISQSIDAERYIAEEFDWIRSALGSRDRADYLSIVRQGRGYKIAEQHRPAILEGLTGWERKMSAVGVVDYMGVVTAVTRYINAIIPRYRSIIVDEAQDFGSAELAIIRRLAKPDQNDLFLCGDAAQHILPKHQSFEAAGIDVKGRSSRIIRNYRNSREILRLAHQVLTQNLSEYHFEQGELEISDPELSYRSSAEPLLLKGASLDAEIAAAIRLLDANDEIAQRRGASHSGCIAIVGYSGFEVQEYGREIGMPVLDGASKFLHGTRFLSDLEQTKGYEFDTMVIVNCTSGQLPPSGAPEQEVFRSASEFYVAMTRAKSQLVLSFSGTLCRWLSTLALPVSQWSDVVDTDDLPDVGFPGFLEEFPDADAFDLRVLTGTEFVLTPYARGLDVELQEKLEDLVDGRGMLQAGSQRRLKWKNVGSLLDDLEGGGAGGAWGPVARNVLKARLAESALGLRPVIRSKPTRRKVPTSPPAAEQTEIVEKRISAGDPPSEGLQGLGLTLRQTMILHSLHIKTARDLLEASDAVLGKTLERAEINALKERARTLVDHHATGDANGDDLTRADLPRHILTALRRMGLSKITDLARLRESKLWSNTQFRASDVQRILRIARDHGVTLRDK